MKRIFFLWLLLLFGAAACTELEPDPQPAPGNAPIVVFDMLDVVQDSSNSATNFIYPVYMSPSPRENYIVLENLLNEGRQTEAVLLPDTYSFATAPFKTRFGEVSVKGSVKDGVLSYSWQNQAGKVKGEATGRRRQQ